MTAPTLAGSDDEALTQALRNLWPILDKPSRQKAIDIVSVHIPTKKGTP